MKQYFLLEYNGPPFVQFGSIHLTLLGIAAALGAWVFFWKPGRAGRNAFCWGVSAVLVVNELGWHGWKIIVGQWNIQEMLPLHLSSVLVWMTPVLLLTRNRRLFAISYFAGLFGAFLALVAPELGIYGFPHFRVTSFFTAHILLFIVPVYLIRVEKLSPDWKDPWRVWLLFCGYTILVMGLNALIGSNYLFVNGNPGTPENAGVLERWPGYVITEAFMFLGVMLALYLPFAWHSRKKRLQ